MYEFLPELQYLRSKTYALIEDGIHGAFQDNGFDATSFPMRTWTFDPIPDHPYLPILTFGQSPSPNNYRQSEMFTLPTSKAQWYDASHRTDGTPTPCMYRWQLEHLLIPEKLKREIRGEIFHERRENISFRPTQPWSEMNSAQYEDLTYRLGPTRVKSVRNSPPHRRTLYNSAIFGSCEGSLFAGEDELQSVSCTFELWLQVYELPPDRITDFSFILSLLDKKQHWYDKTDHPCWSRKRVVPSSGSEKSQQCGPNLTVETVGGAGDPDETIPDTFASTSVRSDNHRAQLIEVLKEETNVSAQEGSNVSQGYEISHQRAQDIDAASHKPMSWDRTTGKLRRLRDTARASAMWNTLGRVTGTLVLRSRSQRLRGVRTSDTSPSASGVETAHHMDR